jgi:preprotein translocase subunit SecG
VIGEGILAEAAGLRLAGVIFAAAVAAVAMVVLVLLGRERATGPVAFADAGSAGSGRQR